MRIERLTGAEPHATYTRLAELHVAEITEGFLSTLGTRFLSSLYRYLAGAEGTFVFVARNPPRPYGGEGLGVRGPCDDIAGFIACSTGERPVLRGFVRSHPGALFAILPKLLTPRRFKRALETARYSSRPDANLPAAEVLNFCVDTNAQGGGAGGALFDAACAEFAKRSVTEVRIVTGESQVSAQRFYEKRGAKLVRRLEVHSGVTSMAYVYNVRSDL